MSAPAPARSEQANTNGAAEGATGVWDELLLDLGLSIRLLRGAPLYTLSVCLTIALGIAATTTIFSVVNAILLRPLPYPNVDRVVMIFERDVAKGLEAERVSPANFADWRSQNTVFELMSYSPLWAGSRSFNVRGEEGNERVPAAVVSSELFPILGVAPQIGRAFTAQDDLPDKELLVILSDRYWRRRFGGDPKVIGQTLTLDNLGIIECKIAGVMPAGFHYPGNSDLWLSGSATPAPAPNQSDRWSGGARFEVAARLKPGVSLAEAQSQMTAISARIAQQYPGRVNPEASVVPLSEHVLGSLRAPLLTLLGAVGFVLLIGCVNAANLMLSRAAARRKEMAIRSALGASGGRLVRQLLTESVLVSVCAGALGAAAAWLALKSPGLLQLGALPRSGEIAPDLTVLGTALALSVLSGVLFGLAPALESRNVSLTAVLRQGGRTSQGGGGGSLRHGLVIAEVALALVLLAGAGLLLRSFLKLTAVEPGFQVANSLVVTLDMSSSVFGPQNRQQAFFQGLLERVRALPGVRSAGGVTVAPMSDRIGHSDSFQIEGRPPLASNALPTATSYGITPGYFQAIAVPLRTGRFFAETDRREAPYVVMINEAAARRYWPGENPIGRRIVFGSREGTDKLPGTAEPRWRQVVGVAGDIHAAGLQAAPRPEVYVPYWQQAWRTADLIVRADTDPRALQRAIQGEVSALNKNVVVERVRTMEDVVAASIAQPRLQAVLLSVFAAAALLLAAVGIFGVMSYTTAQRRNEMALRMALGAKPAQIAGLVLGQTLALTGLGVMIGLAGAASLKRVLETLVFGIPALDPLTLGAVSLLLAAVAVAASLAPALRAARVDPMETLRCE